MALSEAKLKPSGYFYTYLNVGQGKAVSNKIWEIGIVVFKFNFNEIEFKISINKLFSLDILIKIVDINNMIVCY